MAKQENWKTKLILQSELGKRNRFLTSLRISLHCDRFESYSLISPKHARIYTAKSEGIPFNNAKLSNVDLKMMYCPNGWYELSSSFHIYDKKRGKKNHKQTRISSYELRFYHQRSNATQKLSAKRQIPISEIKFTPQISTPRASSTHSDRDTRIAPSQTKTRRQVYIRCWRKTAKNKNANHKLVRQAAKQLKFSWYGEINTLSKQLTWKQPNREHRRIMQTLSFAADPASSWLKPTKEKRQNSPLQLPMRSLRAKTFPNSMSKSKPSREREKKRVVGMALFVGCALNWIRRGWWLRLVTEGPLPARARCQ